MMNLHAIHIQPLKNRILWGFLIFLCIFAPGFDHVKTKIGKTYDFFVAEYCHKGQIFICM